MRKKTFVLVAAAVAVLLTGCGKKQQSLPTSDAYPVMTIGQQNASLSTTYPATIRGIQDVDIRPKVSGFITSVRVHEGQAVAKGQLLFTIDDETYRQAVRQAEAAVSAAKAQVTQTRATVNSAQAQLNTAHLTYTNSQNLYKNKVIGSFELQSARNSYQTAVASLAQARSAVASAVAAVAQAQASLASAKENLSYCFVTSPANGVVGNIPYKVGALVSPSSAEALTTVSNISTMEVFFSMTEKDVLNMQRAAGSTSAAINDYPPVQLQLTDGSTYGHMGKVVKVSGVIDSSTGSYSVIAHFPNPEHLLKSGGAGQIVVVKNDNNSIVIPQDATTQVQDKIFVYKVDGEGKVHYTEIKVNDQNDGKTYIVTSGLRKGERIVTKRLASLSDGMKIKPVTEAQYDAAIKKAQQLSEQQNSAGGFVKAMKSK